MKKRTLIMLVLIATMHAAAFADFAPRIKQLNNEARQLIERRDEMSALIERTNIKIIEIRGALKELRRIEIEKKAELTTLKVKEEPMAKKKATKKAKKKGKKKSKK